MIKTDLGFKFAKLAKKVMTNSSLFYLTSFLNLQAKKSFEKFKKAFCKKPVLQRFDLFKPRMLETGTFNKTIGGILC